MKLNCIIILGLSLLICNNVYAQNGQQNRSPSKIGITFSSFGTNDIDTGDIDCDCGYDGDHFYDLGITYLYVINQWIELETGIEYSKQFIRAYNIIPNSPTPNISSISNVSLISIPLTTRFNFWQYFFVSGGLIFDIDVSRTSPITKQSGLGQMGGVGAQYSFRNGVALFINPYAKYHATIPFSSEDYRQKLLEAGFRFGVTYSL